MNITKIGMNSNRQVLATNLQKSNRLHLSTNNSVDCFQKAPSFKANRAELRTTIDCLRKTLNSIGDDGSRYAKKIKEQIRQKEQELKALTSKTKNKKSTRHNRHREQALTARSKRTKDETPVEDYSPPENNDFPCFDPRSSEYIFFM